MIKITFNDKQVKLMLKDFTDKAINARYALIKIGFLINSEIQKRVQTSGEGLNGAKLPAYSVKYGKRRKSKGRDASFRSLTFTGRMFLGLSARSEGAYRVILGFAGSEVKKAMYNNEKTPFFGIGNAEKSIIDTQLAAVFGRK